MKLTREQIRRRADRASGLLRSCRLCAHRCGVDRLAGQRGYCGLGPEARCFRELLHPAEEAPLNPSHQLYFTGCSLRCEFCSVFEWVTDPQAAEGLSNETLLAAIARRRAQGARSLNLLGGEPTVNLPGILDLLARVPRETFVVWNSNMFFDGDTLDLLDGIVDLYLADWKCHDPACNEALLGTRSAGEVVPRCLQAAAARSRLIVRHVPIPGHWDCCTAPILDWLARHLPNVPVSLRYDYVPPAAASARAGGYLDPEQGRRIDRYARDLGLEVIV